ncbi:MAG: riboflavin synthase [Luminiphilus sp.]|nr:riboflavin synthase [Luminiphilus sp.]
MFTGIVQALGEIAAIVETDGDVRLRVMTGKLPLADVAIGDSISTNGVCLTVTELSGNGYWADVSTETLSLTSLKFIKTGTKVNLEKSVTPTTALGGHLVSGHVDGLGIVRRLEKDARSWRVTIEAPKELAKYIAGKGSICIDGTSLTVNTVNGASFELNIIPQTWEETVFQFYQVGSEVNLEVDIIARYLERLLQSGAVPTSEGLSLDSLRGAGYLHD